MPIEHTKNGAPPAALPMQFFSRRMPDGTLVIRYWSGLKYCGEVSLFAVDEDALRGIVEHLHSSTPRVVRLT